MLHVPISRQPKSWHWGSAVAAFALLLAIGLGQFSGGALAFNVKKVEAGVYKVYTWRLNAKKGVSAGTGFLVSGRRTLITNYHVVADGEKFFVGYRDGKLGRLVEARVVERRGNIDLAVLETYEDLPGEALTLGDYEPEKLANVVAVGFPGAAEVKEDPKVRSLPELLQAMKEPSGFDPTITPGTVSRIYSATNAALSEQQVLNARTVQHNAAINPGNSGGPLFDACTVVIGVNSFFPRNAQGVFFSIHAGEVIRFLDGLSIHYNRVGGPCLTSSLSGGGGLLLPFLIAMSAMLAVAALLFAVRRGNNPLGVISHYAARFSRLNKVTQPAAGASPGGWSAVCDCVSLQAVSGGLAYTLEAGKPLVVGRGKTCAIVLNDDTVSTTHARLTFNPKDQCVAVSDLGSSNGTFLNGARISVAQAWPGDLLRFGTAEFRLAAGAAPPARQTAHGWMLSGFDPAGRALQFELRPGSGSFGDGGERWIIGRDPGRAQFVIDDSSVSGAHAEVNYRPSQGLSLRDLGSTNGTRVDGEAVGPRAVRLDDSGQEIAFGIAKLRLSRLLA
jgi:pSer/pThr/pTyr-binding forkhead associated (FHA) protein/S1-C subfamily serine protease